MLFDEVLEKANRETPFDVPGSWTQGRTIYGGLSTALLVKVMAEQVDVKKSLRALNVGFAAPSLADKPVKLETELLREGRNVAQWMGRLKQGETTCVQTQAIFGAAIESDLSVDTFDAPDLPAPEDSIFYPNKNSDGFSQYFELAQAKGDLPMSGGKSTSIGGWMRFRNAPDKMSIAHLIALIDVWPPASMTMVKSIKAGSTVNWSLQFPQPMPEIQADEFVAYQVDIQHSQDGFSITHAKLWNQKKELLALSQQTVLVFS